MVILHIKHLDFPFVLRPPLGKEVHRIAFLQQCITFIFFILQHAHYGCSLPLRTAIPVPNSLFFKNPLDVIRCFSIQKFLIQSHHNRFLHSVNYQLAILVRVVAKKTLCTHFVFSDFKPSADSPCAVF